MELYHESHEDTILYMLSLGIHLKIGKFFELNFFLTRFIGQENIITLVLLPGLLGIVCLVGEMPTTSFLLWFIDVFVPATILDYRIDDAQNVGKK